MVLPSAILSHHENVRETHVAAQSRKKTGGNISAALNSGSYSSPEATAFVRSMMRRRTLASFTAMKALTSSRPSEVAKKSVIALELRSTFIGPPPGPRPRRCSFVEELDRDLKNAGDLVKTARAHPVHAFLVFLNLLEGDAASLPELLLAHADEHALHAHSRANVTVNVLRLFRR